MKEAILTYAKWVKDRHDKVEGNEQATKLSLIGPLFTLLGYNLTDPQECVPEYKANFGRGERAAFPVDWAFFVNGQLAFFVEAKAAGVQITRYAEQLGMYFAKAPGVKLGILTNGTHWRFFSDLVHMNLMDVEPFFTWDVLNDDPALPMGLLTILQKSHFTPQRIRTFAEKHHQGLCGRPTGPKPPTKGKTLRERFAEVIVLILAQHGPLDTQRLYEQLKRRAPELCTDRGQDRPWVVWERDARNALTYLQKMGRVDLIPTEGYERKGVYRLVE